jgi:hypothetical protein
VLVNHALNLLFNGSFHLFHTALANDGNVHEFLLGTVRNYPVADRLGWHGAMGETENRRLILWKTTFDPEGVYATVYHEEEFRALSGHLGTEAADLEPLVKKAIDAIPPRTPFLVEPKRPRFRRHKPDSWRHHKASPGSIVHFGRAWVPRSLLENSVESFNNRLNYSRYLPRIKIKRNALAPPSWQSTMGSISRI